VVVVCVAWLAGLRLASCLTAAASDQDAASYSVLHFMCLAALTELHCARLCLLDARRGYTFGFAVSRYIQLHKARDVVEVVAAAHAPSSPSAFHLKAQSRRPAHSETPRIVYADVAFRMSAKGEALTYLAHWRLISPRRRCRTPSSHVSPGLLPTHDTFNTVYMRSRLNFSPNGA